MICSLCSDRGTLPHGFGNFITCTCEKGVKIHESLLKSTNPRGGIVKLGEREASHKMAVGILRAIDSGLLDSRSMAADALLSWADITYGVNDGTGVKRLREANQL